MEQKDLKRLSRLSSILTMLQSKRIITATMLAAKFGVSNRTIYRDIRALEDTGVPILTEEGKGYTLMEGYKIPPVMFSEREANALILAEQLILKNKDKSLIEDYSNAITKIKAVLRYSEKDKTDLLSTRTTYKRILDKERSSNNLSDLQFALTNHQAVAIIYENEQQKISTRIIEPFAILSTENWLLIAWCRLRKDFRYFRLDRIKKLSILNEKFKPHKMSLQDFFDKNY